MEFRGKIMEVIPGVLICLVVTLIGIYLSKIFGLLLVTMGILPKGSASPISGIFVAILIGIIIRNTLGLHRIFKQGVAFSLKYALSGGIILLWLRLSLMEALKLGAWGLPLIITCIICGLYFYIINEGISFRCKLKNISTFLKNW